MRTETILHCKTGLRSLGLSSPLVRRLGEWFYARPYVLWKSWYNFVRRLSRISSSPCWRVRAGPPEIWACKRRVLSAFSRILFQIVKTSVSRTSAGVIPVVEWTAALYPLTNLERTSIYFYVFLKVKYLAVYRAAFCWRAPQQHIWRRDVYRLETPYPHVLTTLEIGHSKTLPPYQ